MLPAQNRMRSSVDFSTAVRSGRRIGCRLLVVHHVADAGDGASHDPLVGLVVSKSVGISVVRHRVSRRLRAQLCGRLDELPPRSLTVVRALGPAAHASSVDLARDLDRAFGRLAVTT